MVNVWNDIRDALLALFYWILQCLLWFEQEIISSVSRISKDNTIVMTLRCKFITVCKHFYFCDSTYKCFFFVIIIIQTPSRNIIGNFTVFSITSYYSGKEYIIIVSVIAMEHYQRAENFVCLLDERVVWWDGVKSYCVQQYTL